MLETEAFTYPSILLRLAKPEIGEKEQAFLTHDDKGR
jgi:hypothetical protein